MPEIAELVKLTFEDGGQRPNFQSFNRYMRIVWFR